MKIDRSKLSHQQILNLEAAIKSYNERKLTSSDSPPVLYIELTQNCIARCTFCRRKHMNSPGYNMDDKTFDIILKDYAPHSVLVDLRGWGESLMLPNFDEYVNRIAKFGPKIKVTTTLGCGSKKAMQSLIDNDVYVSVTLDFADKDLYEKWRKGIYYDIVMKNLEFLTQEMKKKGTLKDNIRFLIAPLQKANLEQIEKIIQIAERHGVSEVAIAPLVSSPVNPNLLRYNKRKTIEALRGAAKYAKDAKIKLSLHLNPFKELYIKDKAFDFCCHPWLYVFINHKGDVLFCDHMMNPFFTRYRIGHITEDKAMVWNGKEAQRQRSAHIQKHMLKLPIKCMACYTGGRYADHEHEIDEQFSRWLVTEKDIEDKLRLRRDRPKR